MGPAGQGTPHVIEMKTGSAALLYWRGQNSTAVSSPAVTSSPDVLLDFAHTTIYLVGLLVGASNGGGAHGGEVALDDGEAPVETMASRSNATPSITKLRRT